LGGGWRGAREGEERATTAGLRELNRAERGAKESLKKGRANVLMEVSGDCGQVLCRKSVVCWRVRSRARARWLQKITGAWTNDPTAPGPRKAANSGIPENSASHYEKNTRPSQCVSFSVAQSRSCSPSSLRSLLSLSCSRALVFCERKSEICRSGSIRSTTLPSHGAMRLRDHAFCAQRKSRPSVTGRIHH
jgi:hypothetical protein